MSFRRAAKVDSNHAEIVAHFRDNGFSVLSVAQLKNACDIFISKDLKTAAIEIKDGYKPPSKRRLTAGERKFKSEWQGEYFVVESIEQSNKIIERW